MLFLFTLLAFFFSIATPAELPPREVIDFTVEAGNLVGTGAIEFNSPFQDTEAATETAPTRSYTPCASTAICQANASTVASSEDTPSPLTSRTVLPSQPFPLISGTRLSPSNSSMGATLTPTPGAPVVSDAIAWRHMAYTYLFSLAVMVLFFFIF